jgi:hypothetical protein
VTDAAQTEHRSVWAWPETSIKGSRNVEYLLQRIAAVATAPIPFPTWGRNPGAAGDRVGRGVLWLLLLIVPGSFLVLPLVIWWKVRRAATGAAQCHAARAGTPGAACPRTA